MQGEVDPNPGANLAIVVFAVNNIINPSINMNLQVKYLPQFGSQLHDDQLDFMLGFETQVAAQNWADENRINFGSMRLERSAEQWFD